MSKKEQERLFDQVIQANRGRLYRICYAYLHDKREVSDLYQEILMGIWMSLNQFRKESSVSTYVYRIAVNTAIKFATKAAKEPKMQDDSVLAELPVISETPSYEQKEQRLMQMHTCIQQLSDTDRILISLVLEDLSYQEIADILGMTINLVGVKINRVKKRITKLMEVHYGPL
ncbi:RNA polymerase sigma factor [Alkalimonas delamerensis]|uniref:RNA polymerase sigma factor n=1 Tax=Alkalimonas delamerensis TaxID=265981 RepID=A0ABT9GPX9_9GAMM|nr:RNA polymerase sigma factor [Alkalimonas delamerensis]MDP4528701.1 RNA polymerase sigma factor [Alkalimonas delamerensis]